MSDELPLKELTAQVIELSQTVARFIQNERVERSQIELKSLNNLVSYVDKEAERQLVEGLERILPEAGFITEEGTREEDDRSLKWIIDPLDGTTNYLHQIPCWCTSIGLFEGNTPLIGVICSPTTNETFDAARGLGARLNGKEIQVSQTPTLGQSLLATGFPYDDFEFQANYMKLLSDLMPKTRGIRRLGSAAMDLAYVACGRFEAFYEYGLNPYDVAAGIVLVNEAGGTVSDFQNGNNFLFGEEILASNGHIHQDMLKEISTHFIKGNKL